MTSRTRNFAILGVVLVLLVLSLLVIVPGSPLSKDTKLGLDLEGGIELVYQGRPTPQVPEVTQQALDDATETIRKRTDALGVSEPEIQRSGKDQISIGLPDVQNAERAIEQVGTTAQLQFYDWEPNVLGDRGPDNPFAGTKALYDAVEFASTQKPKAEQTDVPPDSDLTPAQADKQNNTTGDQYYMFGPGPAADRPRQEAGSRGRLRALVDLQGAARRLRQGSREGARSTPRAPSAWPSWRPWAGAARRPDRRSTRCPRACWWWRASRRRTSRRRSSASS